jgi:hypothetical protein
MSETPETPETPSIFNLEFFLENLEDVCVEDFADFTQQNYDTIGYRFFRHILIPEKTAKASKAPNQITCSCGSTINKSSMSSHIKTKKHLSFSQAEPPLLSCPVSPLPV